MTTLTDDEVLAIIKRSSDLLFRIPANRLTADFTDRLIKVHDALDELHTDVLIDVQSRR